MQNTIDDKKQKKALENELIKALDKGDLENVQRLMEMGITFRKYNSPLTYYVKFSGKTTIRSDIVECLMKNGETCNYRNHEHDTALHIASMRGYTDIVRVMLNNGANPNVSRNWHGNLQTPHDYAIWYKRLEVAELLVSRGAISNSHIVTPS